MQNRGLLYVSLVMMLALCAGAGAGGFWLYGKLNPAAAAAASAGGISVRTPQALGSKEKFSDPGLTSTLDGVKARVEKVVPNSTGVVSASYGNLKAEDILLALAFSAPISDPQAKLDELLKAVPATQALVEQVSVEPGPFGGSAKCAKLKSNQAADTAVCAWADSGSIGVLILFIKDVKDLKEDFVAFRGLIERRS